MAVYLKNADFLDWKTLHIKTAHIRVAEGPQGGIEFVPEVPPGAIDCSGKIVTRSFVCAHHHIYSALALGMPPPKKQPANFHQILKYIWWNLDKNLDMDMIRASAQVVALQAARHGVTTVIDHHASPRCITGSLNTIAEELERAGIGHLLCFELSDRDGRPARDEALAESGEYLKNRQGLIGLHASFTVGNDLLHKAVALCEKYQTGIHIHVAEDRIDQQKCIQEHGKRVIERLNDCKALQFPQSILAHCIYLEKREWDLLDAGKAWIAVNTESNLNNGVGLFHGDKRLSKRVMLGTDGMHSDMAKSSRFHYFCHNKHEHLSPHAVYQRLRNAHTYLAQNEFTGDGENNLIILDYNPPTPVSAENWPGHFFYGFDAAHIESVISQGRLIVRNREVLSLDQNAVLENAKIQAKRLWSRL